MTDQRPDEPGERPTLPRADRELWNQAKLAALTGLLANPTWWDRHDVRFRIAGVADDAERYDRVVGCLLMHAEGIADRFVGGTGPPDVADVASIGEVAIVRDRKGKVQAIYPNDPQHRAA